MNTSRQLSYSDEAFLQAVSSPSRSSSPTPSPSSRSSSSPSSRSSSSAQDQPCSSSFPLRSHLHQHRHSLPKINPTGGGGKVSKGKSPFLCKFCQKGFPRQEHMLRHERKHTGERPFKCWLEDCPKRFSRFDNMMQHFRTHTSAANFATASVKKIPKKLAEAEAALERARFLKATAPAEQAHSMRISHLMACDEPELLSARPLTQEGQQQSFPTPSPTPFTDSLAARAAATSSSFSSSSSSSSSSFSSFSSSSFSSSSSSPSPLFTLPSRSSSSSNLSSTPSSFSQLLEQPQLSSLSHLSHLSASLDSSPRSSPSAISFSPVWLSAEEASPSPLSRGIEFSRITPPPTHRDSFDSLLLKKFKGPL